MDVVAGAWRGRYGHLGGAGLHSIYMDVLGGLCGNAAWVCAVFLGLCGRTGGDEAFFGACAGAQVVSGGLAWAVWVCNGCVGGDGGAVWKHRGY